MTDLFLNGRRLNFDAGLPANNNVQILPNSIAMHLTENWGLIILQNIAQLGYYISLNYFNLNKKLEFLSRPEEDGFSTTVSLKNVLTQTVCGTGRLFLKEHQFASIFGMVREKRLQMKKEKELLFLDLYWTRELLSELISGNDEYDSLLKRALENSPSLIGAPYRNTTPLLQELIHTLLNSPYEPSIQGDAISALMEELLDAILKISSIDHWLPDRISEIEIRKVNMAKQFILDNIDEHYSSGQIAEIVGFGRTALIRRFRQVTGKAMNEFLLYHRCLRIRDELMHTDAPLKALAKKSGYSDISNFINGFKKHMGCPPSVLRKNKM